MALNGFLMITKTLRNPLMYNFCLKIFSIKPVDGEVDDY